MALTMTRTRTQTTLTKLAELVAHVHGELEFVEGLLACNGCGGDSSTGHRQQRGAAGSASELDEEPRGRLVARRRILLANRDALYATVRQFDPTIDPGRIGVSDGWRLRVGNRRLSARALEARYLKARQ
jgi:hypothetical protein